MAFHWFDSRLFVSEAERVLKGAGELWVSILVFPGVLVGDEDYESWPQIGPIAVNPCALLP
jgi:hypothetical protein